MSSQGCASTASDDRPRFALDVRVFCAKTAPNHTQICAIFHRNRRTSAPKRRANSPRSHSKIALVPHIICSTSKTIPECVAHSRRACCTQKLCKNQPQRVQFSSNRSLFFSRATHRTFKIWCTSPLHNIQRPPTMIAHVLRSMRASAAPKSRRTSRKITRFSIETGAVSRQKCAY